MHQTLGKHPILLETDARDTLVIPAHGMEKQEDLKQKVILGSIVGSRKALAARDLVSKIKPTSRHIKSSNV